MKLLSFCIPTYHRGDTIQATLESICSQYDDSIEIVVYDSGKDDITKQIVRQYQKAYPDIRYIDSGKKAGIDRDIKNTISFAQGEYSWLLSSDDAIAEGAVNYLLKEMKDNHEVYLCNCIVCDQKLAPINNKKWLKDPCRAVYEFKNRKDIIDYLNYSQGMGSIFSYMSVIIINNSAWRAAPDNNVNYGSCYAHINKLFGMLMNGGVLKYINAPLILNRSFNDSFLEGGIYNRYLIDFRGFIGIAKSLFPDDIEIQRLIIELMIKEHPWYRLVKINSYINGESKWDEIRTGLLYYGYSKRKMRIIEVMGKYGGMVKISVKIKSFMNKLFIRKYFYLIRQYRIRFRRIRC